MTFVEWVCTRRAGDNPRGDFIRDTRVVVDAGRASDEEIEGRMYSGCREAVDEYRRLRLQYDRLAENGKV